MIDSASASAAALPDDPEARAAARVYADAFLAAAGGDADGALDELRSLVEEVLTAHPDFANLLTSEFLSEDDRLGLIDRVVAPEASSRLTNFLKVLATRGRLTPGFIPLVHAEAVDLNNARHGRRRVQVRTARELSEESLNQIRERLRHSFGFEPILEVHLAPELIGGLVLQVGDTVYDSSVRTRLKQLRERLSERANHAIQSQRDRFGHPEGN